MTSRKNCYPVMNVPARDGATPRSCSTRRAPPTPWYGGMGGLSSPPTLPLSRACQFGSEFVLEFGLFGDHRVHACRHDLRCYHRRLRNPHQRHGEVRIDSPQERGRTFGLLGLPSARADDLTGLASAEVPLPDGLI